MRRIVMFLLSGLLFVPTAAWAGTKKAECIAPHYIVNDRQLRWTALVFSNSDLVNPTTIERITVRNIFGDVFSDTGPATPDPHPSGPGGTDISVVPPGGARVFTTLSVFGPNNLSTGRHTGIPTTIVVEWSKEGDPARLFLRTVAFTAVNERNGDRQTANFNPCFELVESEVDDE